MTVQSQKPRRTKDIILSEPIVRGETEITTIVLRKPKAGELRGLSLQAVMSSQVSTILELLPRITQPPITEHEADNLEPEDLGSCAGALIDFFLTPEDQIRIKEALRD